MSCGMSHGSGLGFRFASPLHFPFHVTTTLRDQHATLHWSMNFLSYFPYIHDSYSDRTWDFKKKKKKKKIGKPKSVPAKAGPAGPAATPHHGDGEVRGSLL